MTKRHLDPAPTDWLTCLLAARIVLGLMFGGYKLHVYLIERAVESVLAKDIEKVVEKVVEEAEWDVE